MKNCPSCGQVLVYLVQTIEVDKQSQTMTVVRVAQCCVVYYPQVIEMDDKPFDLEE